MFSDPIVFESVLFERVWGGNRLNALFGKPIEAGKVIGESWELCDRPEAQTRAISGAFAGKTLREILEAHPVEILGAALANKNPARFPLLLKYVDAGQPLSVQVHPDDAGAVKYKDRGKAECWIVVHAEPDAIIVRGLKPGVTRADYERAVAEEHVERVLHYFAPKAGDCIALPPGMVHAIGAGLVVAEIQQNSDVTLRIFDYKRLGLDGKPRALHVAEALDAIRFDEPGNEFQGNLRNETVAPKSRSMAATHRTEVLLKGRFFDLDRLTVFNEQTMELKANPAACRAVMVIAGTGMVNGIPINAGQTLLVPAALKSAKFSADSELVLLVSTPTPESC